MTLKFKCLKKALVQKRILKLMKIENQKVQQCCGRRDWESAGKYLHFSKASVKAYRRIKKIEK